MVMTILEARVALEKASLLEDAYKQAVQQLDVGIVQTALLQSSKDSSLWRIMTVWESRDALDAMRQTGETPKGVLMFRAANAEPVLTVFDVVAQAGI